MLADMEVGVAFLYLVWVFIALALVLPLVWLVRHEGE